MNLKNLSWILLSIACIIIALMTAFWPDKSVTTPQTVIHSGGDQNPSVVTLPGKPYPIFRDTGSTKWVYADTSIKDVNYWKEKYYDLVEGCSMISGYSNVLKDDTSAYVSIDTRISNNEMQSQSMVFQNRRETCINIYPATDTKNKVDLFIGTGVGYDNNGRTWYFSPGLLGGDQNYKVGIDYELFHNIVWVRGYMSLNKVLK